MARMINHLTAYLFWKIYMIFLSFNLFLKLWEISLSNTTARHNNNSIACNFN